MIFVRCRASSRDGRRPSCDGALEMVVADVVGAALEQRERHRDTQRIAHERQVALEQLVLQRLGAGGDDHLAAVEQRGNEIGEGLAGAGAGFGDQLPTRRDGRAPRPRHRQLLRAEAEARQCARPAHRLRRRSRRARTAVVGGSRRRVRRRVTRQIGRKEGVRAGRSAGPSGGSEAWAWAWPCPVGAPLGACLARRPPPHGSPRDRSTEHLVGLRDARLVRVVALAGHPFELGERLQPEVVHRAQAVDGVLRAAWPRAAPTGRARDR